LKAVEQCKSFRVEAKLKDHFLQPILSKHFTLTKILYLKVYFYTHTHTHTELILKISQYYNIKINVDEIYKWVYLTCMCAYPFYGVYLYWNNDCNLSNCRVVCQNFYW